MNTMKNLLFLSMLLFCYVAFAQDTETRKVDSFNKLEAGGSFDVVLEQGNENVITIEAKGVDTEKIITEVKGNVLKVYLKKGNYKNMRATVYITYQNLESISNAGSGNLRCKSDLSAPTFKFNNSGSGDAISEGDIKADRVSFDISGSGNVKAASVKAKEFDLSMSGSGNFEASSGDVTRFSIDKSGSGNVKARGVKSKVCAVDLSGSGNVAISASQSLKGSMSGSGNIDNQGDAAINVKMSGSGKVSSN